VKEIERKFLVDHNSDWRAEAVESKQISQGYIPTLPGATVRVRVKGEAGFLTIKGPTKGISRSEFEYSIPAEDAREMLETLCQGRAIHKIRHVIHHGGHEWTVDEFLGDHDGLLLAEIELGSEDEAFDLPKWATREVSHDSRYFNSNLIGAETPPTV
jgi:CYTH domain-containing protein